MKELRQEAKNQQADKVRKYGGTARDSLARHPDIKEDKAIIREEVKPSALKKPHKADGGAISGSGSLPALGRNRKSGKKGTNVNVIVAAKPDRCVNAPGAGPLPGGPAPMPPPAAVAPRPMVPPPPGPMAPPAGGPGGPLPPRVPGRGPMKRGGAAKKAPCKK